MLRRCAFLLLVMGLWAAACGRADTYVTGGFVANSALPVVLFDSVRSAINGEVIPTDASGQPTGPKVSAIVLSTASDLCNKLKAHPDFFRRPPEAYVALILYAPLDRSGTFYVGRDNGANAETITTAGPQDGGTASADGGPVPLLVSSFAGAGSQVSLSEFALREPGSASGGFDAVFVDQGAFQHELFGRFKSATCDGFDKALLP